MGYTKVAFLTCDGQGPCGVGECLAQADYGLSRVTDTREHAKNDGWTYEPGGKDYCPECSDRRAGG